MPLATKAGRGMLRPPQAKVQTVRMLGEIPKLARIGPKPLASLLRAMAELAMARILLARQTVRNLRIPDPVSTPMQPPNAEQAEKIALISKAIAIIAPRVPWRSDCLVQCLAGRRWLASKGIEARITIGIKQEQAPDGSRFMLAHAWLAAGDIIVTGGDVAEFDAFSIPHKA